MNMNSEKQKICELKKSQFKQYREKIKEINKELKMILKHEIKYT